mgnify:CR=1 FL=1
MKKLLCAWIALALLLSAACGLGESLFVDNRETDKIYPERLNLRAGPGTGYDIIGKIPDYLRLRVYGTMSSAPGWALVQYDQQYGWVSTEYLQR